MRKQTGSLSKNDLKDKTINFFDYVIVFFSMNAYWINGMVNDRKKVFKKKNDVYITDFYDR